MITHEDVKKELGDKVIFSTIPVTMNYLKQQEKKDILLNETQHALLLRIKQVELLVTYINNKQPLNQKSYIELMFRIGDNQILLNQLEGELK